MGSEHEAPLCMLRSGSHLRTCCHQQASPLRAVYFSTPRLLDYRDRHPADDCVGRVVDIADVVAHDLPHEVAGGGGIEPIVGFQPTEHLGGGMLQRLIERPG